MSEESLKKEHPRDDCVLVSAKALANAKRFGIMAMVWTIVAFISLLTFGILLWSGVKTSETGRNTLLAIGVTTTLTASIFAGVAAFTAQKKCTKATHDDTSSNDNIILAEKANE